MSVKEMTASKPHTTEPMHNVQSFSTIHLREVYIWLTPSLARSLCPMVWVYILFSVLWFL